MHATTAIPTEHGILAHCEASVRVVYDLVLNDGDVAIKGSQVSS